MKILYLMSTFNLFGGTPKKTLDLIRFGSNECHLYVWSKGEECNKHIFVEAGASVYQGYYGRNVFLHISKILKIIDDNNIDIIQTQFTFGEVLAGILKMLRPNVKVVTAFVVPFTPSGIKCFILKLLYRNVDHLVFVSNYVMREKQKTLPMLKKISSSVIYNGTERRSDSKDPCTDLKAVSLFDTAGLVDWKNIIVLINAVHILVAELGQNQVKLYVAGDGPERRNLELAIKKLDLTEHVYLLGYQKNIGKLLKNCNIFVHPAYAEGFGIAIAEAMMEGKPIIVSDAGALPELIVNNKSGLTVSPHDANAWANAILRLIKDDELADRLASNAKVIAEERFSVQKYVDNYERLYCTLVVDDK